MFFANVQIPVRVDNICCLFCLLRSGEMCVHLREVGCGGRERGPEEEVMKILVCKSECLCFVIP